MNEILKQNSGAFYVFDTRILCERLAYLRRLLGNQIEIAYAIKANTFIVKELIPYVERFEICSPGESSICDSLGVPPEKTVISGVYKTPLFIEELVSRSDNRVYTVESRTQFNLLRDLSEKYDKCLSILVRLTNDSQFGINEEEIEEIIANRDEYRNLNILGIQFFSGTQKTSIKKYKREINHLDGFLTYLKERYDYTAKELEYGTGFPVSYYEGDAVDEEILISDFAQLIREMSFKTKVTLEIGRSIVASCGSYYTHIVDLKRNKGQNYLLIDGGMHHIVYFGQYMGMKHPIISVCDKETAVNNETWNICGSLCSMNDIVAKQIPLPQIAIGDILRFSNAGAYCMTEGMSLFLSRDLPAVYLVKDNGDTVCVRHTFETSVLNTPQE